MPLLLHTLLREGIPLPWDVTTAAANELDSLGRTPLHVAALYSRFDAVVLLIGAGGSPVQADDNGWRPVDLATLAPLRDYLVAAQRHQPYVIVSVM